MSDAVNPVRASTTGEWWVQVQGQTYGPYRMEQLARFVAEGRVKPTTKVSDRKDGAWVEARRVMGLMAAANAGANAANDIVAADLSAGANLIVHAEILSDSWHEFVTAMSRLGAICQLSGNLWLLRSHRTVGVIRNVLSQTLQAGDRFIVVDASRDRLAWFNLGPETDVRIGRVWNAALPAELH